MTLIPARKNYTVWEGATFRESLLVYNDAERTDPRDFTGFTGELVIRDRRGAPPTKTLTTENGGIELSEGRVDLYISDEDTATMKGGVYDLILTSPSGDADPYLTGRFTVQGV